MDDCYCCRCVDCYLYCEAAGNGGGCDVTSPCGVSLGLPDEHVDWGCGVGAVEVSVCGDLASGGLSQVGCTNQHFVLAPEADCDS